jgi:myo-inositol-1(or 4)-monophosphatase
MTWKFLNTMHAIVNIALRAARDAAELIARNSERLDRVKILEQQGNRSITNMDRDSDRTIIYHLQKAYPDFGIESRLSGTIEGKDSNNTWLIDGLSGSANANKGYTHFCVSVALKTADRVSHGVLVNPLTREEFTASRGSGAQLNASRLRGSKSENLAAGFVSLDAEPGSESENKLLLEIQARLLTNIRLGGCAPLDLAYVAAGKLDAGWTRETDPCTLSAALLILQESGALVSDQTGNPITAGSSELIFANARCFKQLLQLRQSL